MKRYNTAFERRRARIRYRLRKENAGTRLRLTVHRTNQHMYAQIIDDAKAMTLVAASTLEKPMREKLRTGSNKDAAVEVGQLIAQRAREKGIEHVVFDRSGYLYHGRVKCLADAAREGGLIF